MLCTINENKQKFQNLKQCVLLLTIDLNSNINFVSVFYPFILYKIIKIKKVLLEIQSEN